MGELESVHTHAGGGGAQSEREREYQADSPPSMEPNAGLDAITLRS